MTGRDPARTVASGAIGKESHRRERCTNMPRYLIERSFPAGFALAPGAEGADAFVRVIERNERVGVTWIHSYVSADRSKTFCIYDGSSPEAVRRTAADNRLPVDAVTEIRVLDPYRYC
jgi:hypothetical protein